MKTNRRVHLCTNQADKVHKCTLPKACADQGGFTLIELMVALVILSLLSMAAYRGLDSVLQTRDRLMQETRKWQQLSLFFSRLEQDLSLALPRPIRDQGGLIQPEFIGLPVLLNNNQGELTFTRHGNNDGAQSQLAPQRIAYRFEGNKIVLLRWPALDQAAHDQPLRYPVLENVSRFTLRYLDSNGNWLESWPPAGQLGGTPSAIEVTLGLHSNETIIRTLSSQ